MDPLIKDEWLEALRSGRYQQGQGCLRSHTAGEERSQDKFCCLGVLADLIMEGDEWWTEEAEGSVPMRFQGDCDENAYEEAELPGILMARAGLDDSDCSELMNMNDGNPDEGIEPQTFIEIAAHIEEKL